MSQPHVDRIHVKQNTPGERGLPKAPVQRVAITVAGLEGDFNKYRHETLKDTPEQAVLIHTWEMLEQLNAEGWPVKPGDLGENLLTRHLDYAVLGPGVRLRVGPVELEITKPAKPCKVLKTLPYADGDGGTEFIKTLADRRGWYAKVLREGEVNVGDRVERVG